MKNSIDFMDAEILVIGSGIAGLRAALEISKMGKQPALLSKSPVGKATNTTLSGGGFKFANPSFSPQSHIETTLDAGRMLNDPLLVECFVKKAPAAAAELENMGLEVVHRKAGFSCRISGLIGGPHLSATLVRACRDAGVKFLEHVMVTDLISNGGVCQGVVGFQKNTGDWYGLRSKAVVLATGGAGALYAQSDNAPGATGDGYALAMDAGLELIDMEFVQFYPLVYAGSGHASIVIPPAFADLGDIINRQGEDLKEKYGLAQESVASLSRDRLSQAIFREMALGNGIDNALLLDLRKADWSRWTDSERFRAFFKKKIPFDSQPVLITPACHHTMGGIPVNANGQTILKGLFAAGEVVGGVHGANRMGGNALTEGLVFGQIAGRQASLFAETRDYAPDFDAGARSKVNQRLRLTGPTGPRFEAVAILKSIKKLLWEKAGIIRDGNALKAGIRGLEKARESLSEQRVATPRELCKLMECRHALLLGAAIARAALKRTESRGAHFRDDFPDENDQWRKHIHVKIDAGTPVAQVGPALN